FIADLFYNKTELSSTFPVVESSVFFSGLLCNSPFSVNCLITMPVYYPPKVILVLDDRIFSGGRAAVFTYLDDCRTHYFLPAGKNA
ncbi:MAG: hypothetical protein IJC48_00540, partial [Clostridia bacterium]|nr:hypothetical protein [Clostridia bacterium]